jgi:hypothetical protein
MLMLVYDSLPYERTSERVARVGEVRYQHITDEPLETSQQSTKWHCSRVKCMYKHL